MRCNLRTCFVLLDTDIVFAFTFPQQVLNICSVLELEFIASESDDLNAN